MYWLIRVAAALARRVPVRVSYALARAAGVAAFYAWRGGRRRCVRNMLHLTSGDERRARRLARASFGNYAVYLVDFLRFGSLSEAELRERVHFEGWDMLQAQRTGGGIVFVTMHFGNWDLGAAALALNGFPITVLADTFGDARLNEMVIGSRTHLGMDVVPVDRVGPRILRSLKRNDVVAVLIDVPMREGQPGTTCVEFFGAPIAISDGPARLALRAGSSVVAATLPRTGSWTETVAAEVQPVAFERCGDEGRDAAALTQATMRALESLVRRHPEQWYIFRPLWVDDRDAVIEVRDGRTG